MFQALRNFFNPPEYLRSLGSVKDTIERGDLQGLRVHVAHGAEFKRGESGITSLNEAAAAGHVPLLEYILENAQPGVGDLNAALEYAVQARTTNAARVLIEAGADIHNCHDWPLRIAVNNGDLETAKYLIEAGAYLHTCNGIPLSQAAKNGDLEILKLLLAAGASPNADNDTALQNAVRCGHYECAKVLIEHGAFVSIHSDTPLYLAAGLSDPSLMKLLLQREAKFQPHILDRKVAYLEIAKDIFQHGEAPEPRKHFLAMFGFEDREIVSRLKSDAFDKALPWRNQPIVHCALESAMIAVVLADNDIDASRSLFRTLFRADIERVNETRDLSWRKYGALLEAQLRNIHNFRDVVGEVADSLVLPALCGFEELGGGRLRQKIEESRIEASRLIVAGKTSADFAALNNRWHRTNLRLSPDLVPFKSAGNWTPLFEEVLLPGGISVKCLTSARELEEEGKALRHCVGSGSYSNSCRNGSTHIISIRRDGLSKGTIELKEERSGNFVFRRPGGRGFVVGQFRGPGNSNPSSDLHGAWHSVVKGVKEETIALCEQSGMSSKERRSLSRFASSLELHTGIPNELLRINCEKIHRHYSERIFAQRNNGIRIPLVEEEAFKALIARYSRSK